MFNIYSGIKYLVLICVAAVAVSSCNVINPHERIPTYIHIDSFQFTGLGSHEIVAVEAYYNNNPIGSFDLPATIPVMADGAGRLLLNPIVASNGQNDKVLPYYFYKGDTSSFTAQPGMIINYTPKTEFTSTTKVTTISDFEYGQVKMYKCGGTVPIVYVADPSMIFQGNGSGGIFLSAVGDSSIDSTAIFPITNGPAYIEFDYKCTVPFVVGMQSNLTSTFTTGQYYLAGVNPVTQWRKFYMNVTGFISSYNSSNYLFYLKTSLPVDTKPGQYVLIDNIKLISN